MCACHLSSLACLSNPPRMLRGSGNLLLPCAGVGRCGAGVRGRQGAQTLSFGAIGTWALCQYPGPRNGDCRPGSFTQQERTLSRFRRHSPKPRCPRGRPPSSGCRGGELLASPSSWWSQVSLGPWPHHPSLCFLLHRASALCLPLSPSYKKNPSLWMYCPPQARRSLSLTSLTDDICKDPGSAPHWLTVSPGRLRASTCPSIRWTRLSSLRDPAASKRLPDHQLELWTDSSAPDSRVGPGSEGLTARLTAFLLSRVKHLGLRDVSPDVGRRPQCPGGGAVDSRAFLAVSALSRHRSMGNGWFWVSTD